MEKLKGNRLNLSHGKIVKTLIGASFIVVLLLGFWIGTIYSINPADVTEVWIRPPMHEPAYIIGLYNDTFYYVKNGTTGQIDYFDTNQTAIVAWAFSHLNNGTYGTEKVVLLGNFTLNYYPNVPPYADIEVQGCLNVTSKAAFMLNFDDLLAIQYNTYFMNLTSKWGYRGNQGVVAYWLDKAGSTNTSYITLSQLKEMRDAGWSFFSHGYHSSDCSASTMTLNALDVEIRQTKEYIERNLGVRVDEIAWPTNKQGPMEIARQYYNYIFYGNWKAWPNQTWNYITDYASVYFPTETNYAGTKAEGGVIANAAWYAVNSTGGGSNGELAVLTFHGTMTSAVFDLCMGNVSSWGLPVLTVRDLNYYLGKQPKPSIAGPNFKLENEGSEVSAINGTWIKHNIGYSPNSTILTVSGSLYVNSTCYVLPPTVLTANTTHFQIDFCIDNAGTITPIAAADARTIYWVAVYEHTIVYPATT